jgi:GAF domain-containing protein
MGARSRHYFDEAERLGGLLGTMRLASLARITSTEAAALRDTDEVVARLGRAAEAVRVEFGARPRSGKPRIEATLAPSTGLDRANTLRSYLDTVLELIAQRSLLVEGAKDAIRRLDEASAITLCVERVSTWFLSESGDKMVCVDLFERSTSKHSSGAEFSATDHAPYFDALRTERTVAAHEARTDPRTKSFATNYLRPLGIESMLDVPIWTRESMVGVICHEHVGASHTWNSDEETFAYLMSGLVSIALENAR